MLNLAQKCVVILICLIAAAGCGQGDDVVEETAVSEEIVTIVATNTSAPTKTIIPTATSTNIPTPIPPTNTPTATATATPSPIPTDTPTPTQTPTPTIEPTPENMTELLTAPDIGFANVQFVADPELGEEITGTLTDDFGGESVWFDWGQNVYCDVGQIRVWETAVLETWQGPGPEMADVHALLANSHANFPTWGAAVIFQAKTEPLTFQNGRGVRALLNHAQDTMLANNQSLRYEFFGLTDNGRQLIHLCFPAAAPILLDSSIYFNNTNPNALPLPDGFADLGYSEMVPVIQEYNRGAETAVNALNNDQFSTNLTLLDALIESLLVTEK